MNIERVSTVNNNELLNCARDPKYISSIYNYCDRWCERCQFTSRCLNCTIVEEQFGDLKEIDIANEAFWQKFSKMLQNTAVLIKEMANEYGVDIDSIDIDQICDDDIMKKDPAKDILSHMSMSYAKSVTDWFESEEHLFYEKENEMNRIRLISDQDNPDQEAASISDSIEIVRYYQYQIHVKLERALKSASEEAIEWDDDYPKDSDGSAKVALIGIKRSMSAWNILLSCFPEQQKQITTLIIFLGNIQKELRSDSLMQNIL